jgi:tetratricopeptide (TPR) repeat protein
MRTQVRQYLLAVVGVCLVLLCGCGKANIFSWAHQSGSSSDSQALSSDAYTALRDKDYTKALEYYQKILEQDPESAEAIYGYAAAELANAGIDIAGLVANLVKETAPTRNLAPSIAYASNAFPSPTNILPDNILNNLQKTKEALDRVMDNGRLPKIVRGQADGKIDPENPDVNLNLAFCLVLRAAILVQQSGAITLNSDYSVTINTVDMNVANEAGKDIVSAYHRLLIVYEKLNLGSDSTITRIKDDVNTLFSDLKSKVPGITVDINHDYLLD